jgi:hypothetical protein
MSRKDNHSPSLQMPCSSIHLLFQTPQLSNARNSTDSLAGEGHSDRARDSQPRRLCQYLPLLRSVSRVRHYLASILFNNQARDYVINNALVDHWVLILTTAVSGVLPMDLVLRFVGQTQHNDIKLSEGFSSQEQRYV